MMAAAIMCFVVGVPNGTTMTCENKMLIRIAGLENGDLAPRKGRTVLTRLVVGQRITCLPAGNEDRYIVAKCELPDGRDLACTLIKSRAAVRSDAAWRRYGLGDC